jgi:chromosomal replication initiation ATPase DnaA
LVKSGRGSFNEAGSIAMYLARMLRKDSLMDIGSEFGLSGYSSVSCVLQGIGKQLLKNRRLQELYEVLKKAFIKGQTEA